MSRRIGFDIGGTFTDVFLIDEATGDIVQEKVSTTPENPYQGAINGIEKLRDRHDVDLSALSRVSHGTTIATNALLEREGAKTALITTEGFRDLTAIGREKRTDLYNYSPEKTPTFTERKDRYGVPERITQEGETLEPLDEDRVREIAAEIQASDVTSVAVSLLHAYRNDEHEQRIKAILEEHTDAWISVSSEVMPEIKEYERTFSTVINAYVAPITQQYIHELENRLRDIDIDNLLYLMQSSGGVVTPDKLGGNSLRLINSGPAAGVLGARNYADDAGLDDVITLDIGGTSADACIIRDGTVETTTEGVIEEMPLMFPQIDVRTVGAGGGSIAYVNDAGVLKVGPKSAGATPGPACYGRGGERPTVTDAALVLGYLDPDYFLGGDMSLDVNRAKDALQTLSGVIDGDTLDIAHGVITIATTNIAQAVRLVSVEKGYDPRSFALACYGGAGPMFANRLIREMDLERAFIPAAPGVLSASGLVTADERYDFSRSYPIILTDEELTEIRDILNELETEAQTTVPDVEEATFSFSVDLRYQGQTTKLTVDLPGSLDEESLAETVDRFNDQYETIYGHSYAEKPIEVVTWRLQVTAPTADISINPTPEETSINAAQKGVRTVYFQREAVETLVYDRYELPSGVTLDGPAIIEETESTTVVEPDSTVKIDKLGNVHVTLDS